MRGVILGSAPRLKFDSNLNIVVDGNSLVAGQGGAQNIPRALAKTAPVSSTTHISTDSTSLDGQGAQTRWWQTDKGVQVRNLGINGQTWRQMNGLDNGSSSDIDGAWIAGKVNVLVCWEGTNAICLNNRTAAQALQDASDYVAARLAKNKWFVIIGTCLPRQSSTSQDVTNSWNATLNDYNDRIRSSYAAMGAKAVFDVRQAGSVFNLPDYQNATFEAAAADTSTTPWATGETGQHTHLSSNGYIYVVNNCIVPALRRLPRN